MTNVWGMQSASYPDFAEQLLPFLENFAQRSHDRVTVPELVRRISEAEAQVWVCDDFKAVALTRVDPMNVYFDFCSGSDRIDWQDALEDEITRWARYLGRKRVFINGRPGWSKWAKSKGYHEAHREMVKELN